MRIVFCDTNKELVKKVQALFDELGNGNGMEFSTHCGDVFKFKAKNPDYKLCTASNPNFTMGGGLDAAIANKYPDEVKGLKEFVWTDNLFPIITVDENIQSSRSIIKRCLAGIFAYRYKFNFVLTGIGTAIGGLDESILLEEIANLHSANLRSADLSSANLSYADLSSANLRSANLCYADLSSANLSYADLSSANLCSADLSSANLRSANLCYADLSSANLSYADLSSADLSSANLCSADLSYADLSSANLSSANLRSANLSYADLSSATLHSANLSYADLSSADLSYANLRSANLRSADLSSANLTKIIQNELTCNFNLCCPEEGDFIGRKKCRDGYIVKLLIPAKAKRSSATSRKCRASYVKTLEIRDNKGNKQKEAISTYKDTVKYTVGKITKCDNWEKDRWIECGGGIHFFITRLEAEQYN